MLSATSASRGGVRTPLPSRSAQRAPATTGQEPATANTGLASVEMA
jgi:hypothetical protein